MITSNSFLVAAHKGTMKLTFCFFLLLAAILADAKPSDLIRVKLQKDTTVIDGKEKTIANAVSDYLLGLIPNANIAILIKMILTALNQDDIDYWGNVKDQVEDLVGSYINEHNIHQVEVYEKDLEVLMLRYTEAPITSDTYPDKNLQASALSTSIISHRFLTEAALMPESMVLHFEDIASIHVVVLKDVAETYSVPGFAPSRWWIDLDEELSHYTNYSAALQRDLRQWRMDQVSCHESIAGGSCTSWQWMGVTCYDVYTATDKVKSEASECKQLHGSDACEHHCDNFRKETNLEVDKFYEDRVNGVYESWMQLKELSEEMASQASQYRDPVRRR